MEKIIEQIQGWNLFFFNKRYINCDSFRTQIKQTDLANEFFLRVQGNDL
jgi:hypothetical protein